MENSFLADGDLDRRIDAYYGHVGRTLRDARKRAGLTQSQLAEAVDMTRSSIANLEAGRQRIPLHLLSWIAEILKVEPVDLLPKTTMFSDLIVMPDLTDELASNDDRMRSFVETTIAKVAVASRRGP